ncbi:MAG TPA: signal peptide peptidase SppA [Streptosporangiaceae bacterium]|nr:signal peptide peptidase SppA [Streptosporangiaceae bacterium]
MVDAGRVVELFNEAREQRTAPIILELDLSDGVVEGVPGDPLAAFLSRRKTHLRDVLDGIRRGAGDPRVRALIVRVSGNIGLAVAQELRGAVAAFRDAGKITVAWTESFGETGRGTVPYYLATAFDRVCLQPTGYLGVTGVALEEPFFRGALDKLGIAPRFGKRYEYKTAANSFVERHYTPEHEEMSKRLVTSIGEQIVAGVAAGRGRGEREVRELIDRGPLLAAEALEAGLIDRLAYRDEVYADVRAEVHQAAGHEPLLRYVGRYNRTHSLAQRLPRPKQDVVALIHGQGPIRLGRSGRPPVPGQGSAMGSDTIGAAFRTAVKDERVKAIVFRVNSPGGSAVASDAIWREVVLARKAGKPVVVSMGNVAASGGYYVAMGADTIVAQPGTLTGSIGVVVGKPIVSELLDRLGIGMGSVEDGAHARMFSTTRDFTETEWERVNASLDQIYDDFTAKVAEGRGMTPQRVDELARGRVWTGADAHANGLVDELGGLDRALDIAREKAGIATDAPVRPYPHLSPLERLKPAESSEDRAAAGARFDAWGPLTGAATRLGLPLGGPLLLPGDWEIR